MEFFSPDGYYPVDLHVEKVGSAADFLVAKGVLEANPPQAQPQTSPEPAPQVSGNIPLKIVSYKLISQSISAFLGPLRDDIVL